jgi:G3E family GTPase
MKIPITVITGYLGSGKTTLLRHIIDNTDRKYAVLMNEFGSVGIDTRVIRGKNIDVVELKGGCVCCSLSGEFDAAIKEIKESFEPEFIVIETTGVAEPDAIVADITENMEDVRLDAVITVVDADAMLRYPSLGHTGRVQIEVADIILINKTDLVKEDDMDKVQDAVEAVNPAATIFRTTKCAIDVDLILDVNMEKKRPRTKKHVHENELGSFVYKSDRMLDRTMLEGVLAELPTDIFRAKGFFATEEDEFMLNFVFGRLDFESFVADGTEIVFIGKNIEEHRENIIERLKECEIEAE